MVIGIGFWSFSPKVNSFFGNPTIGDISIEPDMDMQVETDIDVDNDMEMGLGMQHPEVHSGLNHSSDHDEGLSIVILMSVTVTLVAMLPFPRWHGE